MKDTKSTWDFSFKCHQLSHFGYKIGLNARIEGFGTQIA